MTLLSFVKVAGHSMEPFLKNGGFVLASGVPYQFFRPKNGDVILFKKTGKIFIKRIIKIDASANEKKYFVKGDNAKDSVDSEEFGWIEKKEIIGKVICRFS